MAFKETNGRPELSPSERGVHINFYNNDIVVISNVTASGSVHLIPLVPAYSEEFQEMSRTLLSHCSKTPPLQRAPTPGHVIACRFDVDNKFYRAVIKKVLPGDEYIVEFIDFGNTQKCKLDKLRAIPDELKECPLNSVEVSLRRVAAPFTGKMLKFLENLSEDEVHLKLQFEIISDGVELRMRNGRSVNEELISLSGQAVVHKKNDHESQIGYSHPATSTGTTSSHGYPSRPEPQPKSSNEVVASPLPKLVKPSEPEPSVPSPAENGQCIQFKNDDLVILSACTNTGSSYITSADFPPDLISLLKKLNDHCTTAPPLGREPKENEVVACLYMEELYCRAVVENKLPNGTYNMLLCDVGQFEECKCDGLKGVPNDLKNLPRQAAKVHFRDVDSVSVTGDIGVILSQLISEQTPLKIRFDGCIDNGVELFRPDGKSINEELREILAQSRETNATEAEANDNLEENLQPEDSVPLPADQPFTLAVLSVINDYHVTGCCVDAPEIELFRLKYAPMIAEYCESNPDEEYRPAVLEMCLAKNDPEWGRALTKSVDDDETREVFFVDYGSISQVKPSEIRKIPQEIKKPLHLLTVCKIIVPGVPESREAWAKIKPRMSSDTEEIVLFKNVTAIMKSGCLAEVTIPELKSLFPN